MKKSDLLVSVDVETTGLTSGFHEMISINCTVVDFNFKKITEFNTKIRPIHFNRIDPIALEINGFTEEQLRTDPTFLPSSEARGHFNIFSQEAIPGRIHVLAQNWPFDKGFLELWLGDVGFKSNFDYHFEDTSALAMALLRVGKLPLEKEGKEFSVSLASLCDHFDIPHKAHDAKGDAIAAIHVYKAELDLIR